MSHTSRPIGQLTTDELINHPQFGNAMKTFEIIQEFGERHYQNMNANEVYEINNLMEDNDKEWWNNLANRDESHKDIGWLIAHGFPFFAQHCRFPIYFAFDHADSDGHGWYRLTTYCQR